MNFENKDIAFAAGLLQGAGYQVNKNATQNEIEKEKNSIFEGQVIMGSCARTVPRGCSAGYERRDPASWDTETEQALAYDVCCVKYTTQIKNKLSVPVGLYVQNTELYPKGIYYTLAPDAYAEITDWPSTPVTLYVYKDGAYKKGESFSRPYKYITISEKDNVYQGYSYNPETMIGWSAI